jgi:hypothetical protein
VTKKTNKQSSFINKYQWILFVFKKSYLMGNGMLTLKFTNLIKVLYKWLYYLYEEFKKSKGAQYFNDIKNHEYEVFVYLDTILQMFIMKSSMQTL